MDLSSFSAAEQAHMSRAIEKRQMSDFLKLYATITEKCFMTCCNDFTSKALSSKENDCIANCADKFIKHSERIGARFAEQQAEVMNSQSS